MIIPKEIANQLRVPEKVELNKGRVRDVRGPEGFRLKVGSREYPLSRPRS